MMLKGFLLGLIKYKAIHFCVDYYIYIELLSISLRTMPSKMTSLKKRYSINDIGFFVTGRGKKNIGFI